MCLGLLHDHDSLEASLLRGRAHLRLGAHRDALAELSSCFPSPDDHLRSAEHHSLRATALARTGDFPGAFEAIDEAVAYAASSRDRETIVEAAYYRALTYFMARELDAVDDVARDSLDDRAGTSHGRLLELLGLTAALHGDVERQILMLRAASDHFSSLADRDLHLEANVLNNLAIPVAEVGDPLLADLVRRRAEAFPWNDDLRPLRFHVVHHLAWLDALSGDYLSAFRHLRFAMELAPTPARRAEALVSRSYLAREISEPVNAAEYAAEAGELVAAIDWDATLEDERTALLDLAMLLAPIDPRRAAVLAARYRAIPGPIASLHTAAHGDRIYRAKELHAFGLVACGEGRGTLGIGMLREAYALFVSASSFWRAAVVALDIHEAVDDSAMLAFARSQARRIPHSWLARRLERGRVAPSAS